MGLHDLYQKLAIVVEVCDHILQIMRTLVILWRWGAEDSWEIHQDVYNVQSWCTDY